METLTLRYNELSDVAQDLDLVIQSTLEGEWQWQAADAKGHDWDAFVRSGGNENGANDLKGLSGSVSISPDVTLAFVLGSCESSITATVKASAPTLPHAYVKDLKESLATRATEWEEQGVSSLFFFELVTAAQTYLAEHPSPSEEQSANQSSRGAADFIADQSVKAEPKAIRLKRAILWSHHLKAPSKLKDFNNWCPELDLWGILLVGWPGYLCFEGPTEAVDEMIRRVKRLQWHAIQLRLEEKWEYKPDSSTQQQDGAHDLAKALLSCPFSNAHPSNTVVQGCTTLPDKVRTGCQVLTELGDMVARLRACGMEEPIVTQVLGLRIRREHEK